MLVEIAMPSEHFLQSGAPWVLTQPESAIPESKKVVLAIPIESDASLPIIWYTLSLRPQQFKSEKVVLAMSSYA